jgi:hypothetical protein
MVVWRYSFTFLDLGSRWKRTVSLMAFLFTPGKGTSMFIT